MAEYAVFQQSGVDDAAEFRVNLSGLFPSIGSLKSRSGLLDSGGAVTLNSGMSVNVSKFRAFIQGTSGALQGGYFAVLDTDKILTFDDGSGSNRTDLVVARVYHDSYDSSGFTKFAVEILKGTPGGGTPATPVNAIKLAEKIITPTMSAGTGGLGTAPVDKRPPRLVAVGGCVPVADAADRDSLDAYDGLEVYRVDNHTVEQRISGAWKVVYAAGDVFTGTEVPSAGPVPPAGTRKITKQGTAAPATDGSGNWSITFPEAFPNGVVGIVVSNGDGAAYGGTVTTTGTSLTAVNGKTNPAAVSIGIRVNYIAIGW